MAKATDTPNGEEKVQKQNAVAIAARKAAMDRLVAAHSEEWASLHGDERQARGLAREAGGESNASLLEKEAKLLARLEKLQAAKAQRGLVS